jgi:hypothetical protein
VDGRSDGIDPGSRGPHIDARRLATLERIYGDAFIGIEGTGNPNAEVGGLLDHTYQGLVEMVYAQLMAQSHLADLWMSSAYTWDAAAQTVRGDLSDVIAELQNLLSVDPAAGRGTLGEFARTIRGLGVEAVVDYQAFRDLFTAQGEDIAWIVDLAGRSSSRARPATTPDRARHRRCPPGRKRHDTLSGTTATTSSTDRGSRHPHRRRGRRRAGWRQRQRFPDGRRATIDSSAVRTTTRPWARRATTFSTAGTAAIPSTAVKGHDTLRGGAGADTLLGRDQDDTLSAAG